MTYGEILFYVGIGLAVVAGLLLIIGNIICIVKKQQLKKKLYDKYGF